MKWSSHIHRKRRPRRARALEATFGVLVTLLATLASCPDAAAEPGRLAVDWSKLAVVLGTAFQPRAPHAGAPETLDVSAGGAAAPVPWLGAAPRLSLVARDWARSRQLLGDLSVTDELRTSHSSRMVVSRVRLADGVVAPFAQLGIGEWRVDTTLFPTLPHARAFAGQVGVGFEVALAPGILGTVLAFEAGWTLLDAQDPGDVLSQLHPSILSSCLAMRSRF